MLQKSFDDFTQQQDKLLVVLQGISVLSFGSLIVNIILNNNLSLTSAILPVLLVWASWELKPEKWYFLLIALISQSVSSFLGVMPEIVHSYLYSAGCAIVAVVVYRLKETYFEFENKSSFKKIFIYILVALMLPTVSIWGKTIWPETERPRIDPAAVNFYERIEKIAFNRDGTLGVIAKNQIILWDIDTNEKTTLSSGGKRITAMAFSPDGRYLAVGRGDRYDKSDNGDILIELWDLKLKEMIPLSRPCVGNEKRSGVFVVVFSPDSKYLAVLSQIDRRDETVDIWDIQKRKLKMQDEVIIPTKTKRLPNESWIACMVRSDSLSVWDEDTGRFIKWLPNWYRNLSYSPDSRFLAIASHVSTEDDYSKGSVELWDVQTEMVAKELIWNEKHVQIDSLAYSPDGKYLLTGGTVDHKLEQGTVSCKINIQLWDVESGESRKYEFDQPFYIGKPSVAFSPDGKRMAATSGDYVKVWEVDR